MRKIILKIIKIYQKTVSLDHGPLSYRYPAGFCKFYPTCSQYAYQAIECFGVLKGGGRAILRVLRCNPLSHGGYNPIKPDKVIN